MAAGIAGQVKNAKKQPFILFCKSSYLSCQKHLSRKQKLRPQGGLTETCVHWCTTQMQPTDIERESIFLPFSLKTTKVVRHTSNPLQEENNQST